MDPVAGIALQTPTPGLGPEVIGDLVPWLRRAGWFVAGVLVVVLLGRFLVVPGIGRAVRSRNPGNPTLQEAVTRYVRLVVLLVGLLAGALVAGFGPVLSDSAIVVAAGTLAVGVAAQSVISSLVSGLVLVHDPHFNVGDYIEFDDTAGVVQSITLRVTRVVTPGGELVTVPNTVLTSQTIARPYGRGRYRLVEYVGIAFEADVDDAIEHLEAAGVEVDEVLPEPAPAAYVDEFGSDAVVVRVHLWVGRPRENDLFGVRSAFARAAKRRLDEAGIVISPASKRELLGRLEVADGP